MNQFLSSVNIYIFYFYLIRICINSISINPIELGLAGKFQLALKDLETVARTHPNDKDAQDKYKKCKQVAFKQAFEKAIASDKPEAPTDAEEVANADNIALEPDYAGPRFEERDGQPQLTLDFVKQLLDTFKAQKKLHRKFAIQASAHCTSRHTCSYVHIFTMFTRTLRAPRLILWKYRLQYGVRVRFTIDRVNSLIKFIMYYYY